MMRSCSYFATSFSSLAVLLLLYISSLYVGIYCCIGFSMSKSQIPTIIFALVDDNCISHSNYGQEKKIGSE